MKVQPRSWIKDEERHIAWYAVGDSNFKDGHFKAAAKYFRRAERSLPGDRDTLFAIGNCYAEMGQAKKARWYFGVLVDLNPRDYEAWYNLGNTFFDEKDFRSASRCYRRAAKSKSSVRKLAEKNLSLIKAKLL